MNPTDYAERGFAVVPVEGKRPIGGIKSASKSPEAVARRFEKHPEAGIGVVCRPSGILAIDVDERHGGHEQLHDLEQKLGTLPEGPRSLTGGGGLHLLFENPQQKLKGQLAPGVELKDKHMIVVPESPHASGERYRWDPDRPFEMALPQFAGPWLSEALAVPSTNNNSHKKTPNRLRPRKTGWLVREGERHAALVTEAAFMRSRGWGQAEIEAGLISFNLNRCIPPSPEREVRAIARDYASLAALPPWKLDPLTYAAAIGDAYGLKLAERAVLAHLCAGATAGRNLGGDWLWQKLGYRKQDSVYKHLKKLEALGLIRVSRVKGAANRIRLTLPDTPTNQENE